MMGSSTSVHGAAGRALKGLALAALGIASACCGAVFYGIMDYLYQPECFRAGETPSPSAAAAPGKAGAEPARIQAAGSGQSVVLRFTAGPGGISEDGGIKVGLCRLTRLPDGRRRVDPLSPLGWGILQNTRPSRANHFTVDLFTRGRASLEVERKPGLPVRFALRIAARELLRSCGTDLRRLDYDNLLLEQSKIKVRVRGGRLEQGDEVVFTLGGRRGGWKVPVRPLSADFLVEVDERALGRYRLIEGLPSLQVTGEAADLLELGGPFS